MFLPAPTASAAPTSARCVNACGKLPSWRWPTRVVLLGEQPDVVADVEQPLEQLARLVVLRPAARARRRSQNEQGRKTPSPGGRPSTVAVRLRDVAEHEAVERQLAADRRDGRDDTRIVGPAGSRRAASASTLASSPCEPYDCANACLLLAPRACADLGVDLVAQRRASARPGRRGRTPRGSATARSNATQAITFECVKCRCGPRTSQMPASGSRQPSSSHSSSFRVSAQTLSSGAAPVRARLVERVDHLAVDVELELRRGRVADPHRPRALVARAASRARARRAAARRRCRT